MQAETSEVVVELEDPVVNSVTEILHSSLTIGDENVENANSMTGSSHGDEYNLQVLPRNASDMSQNVSDSHGGLNANSPVTTGTPVVVGNPVSMAIAMMDQNCCQQCCSCSCVPNLDLKSRNQARISSIVLAVIVLVQCVGSDVLASKLAMQGSAYPSSPQVRARPPSPFT